VAAALDLYQHHVSITLAVHMSEHYYGVGDLLLHHPFAAVEMGPTFHGIWYASVPIGFSTTPEWVHGVL
jgi:hypothetical protein